jgi:protein-L-isoaspartate(D-aspartate) O-methyltransferase
MDFDQLRAEMVNEQLITRGITDKRVLDAFRKVPRHLFIPENLRNSAYDDCALPIGSGQTISQPYMVAIMTEKLEIKGPEKVLEVGTGSGYQAAILAELAQKVVSIERHASLSENAQKILLELGYTNVEMRIGDGTEGFVQEAPFDTIIVTAACPAPPPPLIDQLAEGGRLVLPVGDRYLQNLTIIRKIKGKIETESSIGCMFVPLLGRFGFNPDL